MLLYKQPAVRKFEKCGGNSDAAEDGALKLSNAEFNNLTATYHALSLHSLRTLCRRIQLATMPRARIDLRPHQDQLQQWVTNYIRQDDIRSRLLQQHGITISRTALTDELRRLDIKRHNERLTEHQIGLLRIRIAHIFYALRLTDKETIKVLQADGFKLSIQKLAKIRKSIGLYKHVLADSIQAVTDRIEEVLKHKYREGNIKDLRRRILYNKMRSKYNLVSRYALVG